MAGIDFFNKVAALAEEEGHHPDLHLEGYRQVKIVLWTHAVGGLTENDFILAAKINEVPVQVRRIKGNNWQPCVIGSLELARFFRVNGIAPNAAAPHLPREESAALAGR